MTHLQKSCYPLDKQCYDKFNLSEDILMEHASMGMANYIRKNFKPNSSILIVVGVGNNGADGLVLARQLLGEYDINIYIPQRVKSPMAKLQLERLLSLNPNIVDDVMECDIVVDCIFGAGLSRELDNKIVEIIERLNYLKSFKIACDIPTGIDTKGNPNPIAFKSDITITMGALKEALYNDMTKDLIGDILCVDLGINAKFYNIPTDSFILEESDFLPPIRTQQNSHKGTYGHLAIIGGDKEGAFIISALSSLRFGVGLATIVSKRKINNLPFSIMRSPTIAQNTTAIAMGMGFGKKFKTLKKYIGIDIPIIIDADILHHKIILKFLKHNQNLVLTPHPKEFVSIYILCMKKEISIEELQSNRIDYVREFTNKYPKATILLKGANMIIAKDKNLYINPLGSSKLSKGGSGDVLSGLIGSLLAQGYDTLNATIQSSLALVLGAKNYPNSYSMLPTDLIDEVSKL